MQSTIIVLLSMMACLSMAIPATFDLRYQPSAFNAYYAAESETMCEAFTWANRLGQVVGNSYSLVTKSQIRISGRHIAECLGETINDLCIEATEQNIRKAIDNIVRYGAYETSCQNNRYLQAKGEFCRDNCDDGGSPTRIIKPKITQQSDSNVIINKLGQGNYSSFVIIKVYDQMKYYSPEHEENLRDSGDYYGVTVGEVVGWKKNGQTLTIKMGGPGWGFKGYANVPTNSPLLISMFTVFYDKFDPRTPTKISVD